jgi:hypothetical protein
MPPLPENLPMHAKGADSKVPAFRCACTRSGDANFGKDVTNPEMITMLQLQVETAENCEKCGTTCAAENCEKNKNKILALLHGGVCHDWLAK